MLSALIRSRHSYPAVQLTPQPEHQRSVIPGPLVLRNDPIKYPAPAEDKDRTVSRRSEPNSRTTLIGEQPNPWDLLQPQDVMSRHRGAKQRRRYGRLGAISLLYDSTFHRWITRPYFRNCSIRRSYSKAHFYPYALHTIANRVECTFGLLRYNFGGNRPSQTDPLTRSLFRIHGTRLDIQFHQGGISPVAPRVLA